MHSCLPQQLTNFKFTRSRILIGLFEKLENKSLKNSEGVITICPELEIYAQKYISDRNRLFLIENSILDEVKFKNQKSKEPAEEPLQHFPKERSIVFYAGTFEFYQGLDCLIRAFPKVLKTHSGAFLLMVGGNSAQVDKYRKLAQECGILEQCLFTGQVSQPVARAYMQHAAVITSPRSEGTNTPFKRSTNSWPAGFPLVATRILSHTQVLNDEVCVLVDPSPESMAEGLIKALTDKDVRNHLIQNARRLYETKYSRLVYKEKMSKLLKLLK